MGDARLNLYVGGDTPLARRHPFVKLGLVVSIFLAGAAVESPFAVLPLTLAVAVLTVASGALGNVRRLGFLFISIPLATFLIWCLFYGQGDPLPIVGAIGVTGDAVRYAAGLALRLGTFLGATILFLSVTRVEEATAAMRALGLPSRIAFTVALSFRLVPLFLSAAGAVVSAQEARGLERSRGGLVARLRGYVPVLVPVFMGGLRRADTMAIALEARGFGASRVGTLYPRARFGVGDGLALLVIGATTAVYLWAWMEGRGRVGG